MKTMNILGFNKVAYWVTFLALTTFGSQFGLYGAGSNLPGLNTANISAETQSNNRACEIGNWLQNELKLNFEKFNLYYGKYNASIKLSIGKTGEITSYEVDCKNKIFKKELENILNSAPAFQQVFMNGFPVKEIYTIPVTFVAR